MSDEDQNKEERIRIIGELLRIKSYRHVINACDSLLETEPREPRVWNLFAIALGAQGDHRSACKAFIAVIRLRGFDCPTLTNIVTSLFGMGKPVLGGRIGTSYFDRLCPTCQGNLLNTIFEGLRIGAISREQLHLTLKNLISNVEPI